MRASALYKRLASTAAVAVAALGGAAASATTLLDGGFENGAPPASSWTYTGNNNCGAAPKWDGQFYWGGSPAPYAGSNDFWAGGYCGNPISDSVTQNVLITPGDSLLSFQYVSFRPSPDDLTPDLGYVSVNGVNVWSLALTQANDVLDWTKVVLNLTAYAGQNVALAFGVSSNGDTGNVRFDAIGFNAAVPEPGTLAVFGLGLAGLFASLRRRVRA